MIPLRDESPKGYLPFVNYIFIALNIYIFFIQPVTTEALQAFYASYGVIPVKIMHYPQFLINGELHVVTSPVSSLFIHGDLMHLIGNMLFLWIFGDNIEYIVGHVRYILFYFICGMIATAGQIFVDPVSEIPVIGASGAISGLLGAYILKFPRNRVTMLFVIIIFIRIVKIPAFVLLGLWFAYQLFMGYVSFAADTAGGVAWFAHIGGFVAGFILIKFFEK